MLRTLSFSWLWYFLIHCYAFADSPTMAPEQPRFNARLSTKAFPQNIQKAAVFLPSSQCCWIFQQNGALRKSIHQTAMAFNHCWADFVCDGHLDRHCTGTEIFSRETVCVDWTNSNVRSGGAAADADLQLCLVQGRHGRCSDKSWRKRNHIRHVQRWTCCPAPTWHGHIHQVWNEHWLQMVSTMIRELQLQRALTLVIIPAIYQGAAHVPCNKECLHVTACNVQYA